MPMPFFMIDAISVADQFGKGHPFVALFEKTGYVPKVLAYTFALDDVVIYPTEYGEKTLPAKMLEAGEWLPDDELLQKYYGISAEDVRRLEICV